jgi:GYF domain 2
MLANCSVSNHTIASAPEQGPSSLPALETWYVATSSGTRAMTLDELDEALACGQVDASTRVWIPGMSEWEALGSVASLEDGPPLECTPGAMLEYGLDAERALQKDEGSISPSVGDIVDYDPFAFPPPSEDIPDPNRALWASIHPPVPEPIAKAGRLSVEPWWRADRRMPWVGLIVSATFVLCMSVLGVARQLFAAPAPAAVAEVALRAERLSLAPQPAATPEPSAKAITPAPVAERSAPSVAVGAASALVRYDEPDGAPSARAASASLERGVGKRTRAPRAVVKKRGLRPLARR